MKIFNILIFTLLTQGSLAHAQGNTGNIVLASIGKYHLDKNESSAPIPDENVLSCRVWFEGVSVHAATLFSAKINETLLRKGYLPLQRGNHNVNYTRKDDNGLNSFFAVIEKSHQFGYNFDLPLPGDIIVQVQREQVPPKLWGIPARLVGVLMRFGQHFRMSGPQWYQGPGHVVYLGDTTPTIIDWVSEKTFQLELAGNDQAYGSDGNSHAVRRAFLDLVEKMPPCSDLKQ